MFSVLALASFFSVALGSLFALFTTRTRISFVTQVQIVSPTQLSLFDILTCYRCILIKTILRLLGQLRLMPNGDGFDLPEIVIDAPLVVDDTCISDFLSAARLERTKSSPEKALHDSQTVPLLLVAATSPMFPLLLAHPKCPIAALGSVNTRNAFEMLRPELLKLGEVKSGRWNVRARMGGRDLPGTRAKRGIEWSMVAEVRKGSVGEEGDVVFRQTFSALKFLPNSHPPPPPAPKDEPQDKPVYRQSDIELEITQPPVMRWAGCCSDYQPIHVSPFLAKYVFGLPSSIAHGNLVVASLVQAARSASTSGAASSASALWYGVKPWRMTVQFKRPMVIPSTLEARFADQGTAGTAFEIVKGDKLCVEGEVRSL